MLAVDHDRLRLSAEIENSFDLQQVFAARAPQISRPARNGYPVERLEGKHEVRDRCIVVSVAAMSMIVVLELHAASSRERSLVEPAVNVHSAGPMRGALRIRTSH